MSLWINPSLVSNGSGTFASPYNSFTEVNALTGDRSGEFWYIRTGTTISSKIVNASAFNYTISTYGEDARPIINATGNNYGVSVAGNNICVHNLDIRSAAATGIFANGTTCNNLRL